MAAAWAAIKVLKVTTQFLLSPFLYSSSLFLKTIGYAPSSSSSTSSGDSSPSPAVSPTQLFRTVSKTHIALLADTRPAVRALQPSLNEVFAGHDGREGVANDTDDFEIVEMPAYASSEGRLEVCSRDVAGLPCNGNEGKDRLACPSHLHDLDADSEAPADAIHLSHEYPMSPGSWDLSAETNQLRRRKSPPFSSQRPLTLILSQFSRRATARLSSFELLPDDPLDSPRQSTTTSHLRVPTVDELRYVSQSLEKDMEEVERAIDEAVQQAKTQPEEQRSSTPVSVETTYFATMGRNFADVRQTSQGIDSESFLEAIESFLDLFATTAPSAHALVSLSILEDIRRVRVRLASHPRESSTIQELVRNERGERRRLGTEGVVWLVRGLKFTARALRITLSEEAELAKGFARAWEEEYQKYFSWLLRPFFKLVVKACPTRTDFFSKLGGPPDQVRFDFNIWLSALEKQVHILETFIKHGGYDKSF